MQKNTIKHMGIVKTVHFSLKTRPKKINLFRKFVILFILTEHIEKKLLKLFFLRDSCQIMLFILYQHHQAIIYFSGVYLCVASFLNEERKRESCCLLMPNDEYSSNGKQKGSKMQRVQNHLLTSNSKWIM